MQAPSSSSSHHHHSHHPSAALSASSTSSAGSSGHGPPARPARKHRHSSRTESTSSASAMTLKRPGSVSSSGTAIRGSALPMQEMGAAAGVEPSLLALRVDQKRRKSVATIEPRESGSHVGLDNLHRWSQSTNSSAASKRNRSSSGAALNFSQAFSPTRRNRAAIDHSPRASPNRYSKTSRPGSRRQPESPAESPARDRRQPSKHDIASLPPLHTTPGLTDPNDTESPSTTQTVATPANQPYNVQQDYFGVDDGISPRTNPKAKKPVLMRNHTAPMSTINSTRLQPTEYPHEASQRHKSIESRDITGKSKSEQSGEASKSSEKRNRDSRRVSRSRTKDKGEKDKKSMLSKALQKANTAVLLDNAQNFEGALEAYGDACKLLQAVMDRSSGEDDQRKLAAIRVTYTNRIEELRQLEADRPRTADEKSLPARPMSEDSLASPVEAPMSPMDGTLRDSALIETATAATRVNDVPKLSYPAKDRDSFFSKTIAAVQGSSGQYDPDRRITFFKAEPSPENEMPPVTQQQHERQRSVAGLEASPMEAMESPVDERRPAALAPIATRHVYLPPPDQGLMPTPLSPRRPSLSPSSALAESEPVAQAITTSESRELPASSHGEPADTAETTSWLVTVDESGSSDGDSVHSVGPQHEIRRKHLRGNSDSSVPDFDAAFDAAVEAAYDEGFEPDMEGRRRLRDSIYQKHAAKESLMLPSSAIKEILSPTAPFQPPHRPLGVETEEDEEEERLLDDITQDYANTFNFDVSSKSALPRQSDSSGYSRSTWQSSQVSDRTTAGTSLSTVAEDASPIRSKQPMGMENSSLNSVLAENLPPSAPPPQGALPRPPSMSQKRSSGVRDRRLSGQNAKVLKIETAPKPETRKRASTYHAPAEEENQPPPNLERTDSDTQHEQMLKSPPSLDMLSSISDSTRPTTAMTVATHDPRGSEDEDVAELRSYRPQILRKNKSSVSLRDHQHTVRLSPTEDSLPSAATPMSSTFSLHPGRRNDNPLTSQRAHFPSFSGGPAGSGDPPLSGPASLFDTSLSTATLPTSPRSPTAPHIPTPLEPCPSSFLLRPFWLLRAIHATLTHPRGGFLTTRLFVPREVWLTRGVKLKSVEEKIANCDLLTAALGRLGGVDTYDADAVAEGLEAFEEVMERVQGVLGKRLGGEVGVGGLAGLWRDAPHGSNHNGATASAVAGYDAAGTAATTTGAAEKTKSKEGKGYLHSLRKLRSKSSGTPLSHTANANPAASSILHRHAEKDVPTLASVPMTSFVPVERRRRGVAGGADGGVGSGKVVFEGPQREYMASLARLCEGVEVLDLIARQAVDPGLRGSSPTHVGLELSVRHAAEFFAFYVCRFVLADVGTLVEKFVKRGGEWVLA